MSIANLYRQGETSPYNIYQFSGKLYDERNDNTFDTAGNVLSYINDCLGSSYQTTKQKYTYDALYQLVKAQGECKYSFQKNNQIDRTDTYTQTFQYDTAGNLTRKTTQLSDVSRLAQSDLANRDLSYEYNSDYAHRLKKAGSDYY